MSFKYYVLLGLLALIAAVSAANWAKVVVFLAKVRGFYHEVRMEMRKVSWPTKDHVVGSSILVGIATVCLMCIIGAVDVVFMKLVTLIYR